MKYLDKEPYDHLKMEMVRFETEDVITDSNGEENNTGTDIDMPKVP
ncbi:MAG: hypothetical protein IJJ43_02845 [Oscillospiraceae bacterium]|nr:hypothetical protein [Oscillospiraceae bacterium]